MTASRAALAAAGGVTLGGAEIGYLSVVRGKLKDTIMRKCTILRSAVGNFPIILSHWLPSSMPSSLGRILG